MKPRWLVALMLVTMPVWFVPALIIIGWKEEGREYIDEVPKALRYALFGRKPGS